MSITESIPPHPSHMWPTQTVSFTTFTLDDVRSLEAHATAAVGKVQADADEKIRALEVTAANLAAERYEAQQEALNHQLRLRAADAANLRMVADHLRRQEALQAELGQADAENAAQHRVNLALQGHLDDANRAGQRYRERIGRLIAAEQVLRTELDDAETRLKQAGGRHRFRRN